jgi:hypothetical protein
MDHLSVFIAVNDVFGLAYVELREAVHRNVGKQL